MPNRTVYAPELYISYTIPFSFIGFMQHFGWLCDTGVVMDDIDSLKFLLCFGDSIFHLSGPGDVTVDSQRVRYQFTGGHRKTSPDIRTAYKHVVKEGGSTMRYRVFASK